MLPNRNVAQVDVETAFTASVPPMALSPIVTVAFVMSVPSQPAQMLFKSIGPEKVMVIGVSGFAPCPPSRPPCCR